MIKSNLLKYIFRNVYFINGTAYAGKSTMVKLLAEKYDGICCGENYHDIFMEAINGKDQPNLSYFETMKDWQEFVNRTPEEYERWIVESGEEATDLEILRLVQLANQGKKIFVDTNISTEKLREISDYRHVAILLAPPGMSVDRFFERGDEEKQFILSQIQKAADPEWTMQNFRECLARVNSEKNYRAFEESGFFVLKREDGRTLEQTMEILEKHFGLGDYEGGDRRANQLLGQIRESCRRIFGDNLVGVYVHGSIAFGCFVWEQSDIDFIIVTKEAPGLSEKEALISELLELDEQAPPKGFEMSLVLQEDCRNFVYPTPFELHFSNSHKQKLFLPEVVCGNGHAGDKDRRSLICKEAVAEYCREMRGTDPDLAAHFTVLRSVGITLCGRERSSVFAEVPRAAYVDSICSDIANAVDEVTANPVYMILNLCRVLAFLKDGLVCSKEQGGLWADRWLPQDFAGRALVGQAEQCYRTGEVFDVGNGEGLKAFAAAMLAEIEGKRHGNGD